MPRFAANRFAVPAGRIASVIGVLPTVSMHFCTEPSPPHTNRSSTPASMSSATIFGTNLLFGTSRHSGSSTPCSASSVRRAPSPPPRVLPECARTPTTVTMPPPVESRRAAGAPPDGRARPLPPPGFARRAARTVARRWRAGRSPPRRSGSASPVQTGDADPDGEQDGEHPHERARQLPADQRGSGRWRAPTYRVTALAVCPDGKLEVGGPTSSCGTVGRCLPTINVVTRTRRTRASARRTERRPAASTFRWRARRRDHGETASMTTVDPRSEPILVTVFSVGVRSAYEPSAPARVLAPSPAGSRTWVSNRPSPMIAAPSTTKATTHTITAANARPASTEGAADCIRARPPGRAVNALCAVAQCSCTVLALVSEACYCLPSRGSGKPPTSWVGRLSPGRTRTKRPKEERDRVRHRRRAERRDRRRLGPRRRRLSSCRPRALLPRGSSAPRWPSIERYGDSCGPPRSRRRPPGSP